MKTKWDLKQLFLNNNIDEYTAKKISVWESFADKYRKNKGFLKSDQKLKQALDEFKRNALKYDVVDIDNLYYKLASDLDLSNSTLKQQQKVLSNKSVELINKLEFFTLELGKVSKEKQKEFLASPILKEYKYFLKRLFINAKYFLAEESEKIMNLLSQSSVSNWERMTEELLNTHRVKVHEGKKEIEVNLETLLKRMRSQDQKIRKEACDRFNEILEKYKKEAEYEMNSILDVKRISDNLRGYRYPEEANYISNDISKAVVDILTNSVVEKYNISHRYYQLKAKLLGKKKLEYYERNVMYGDYSRKMELEQAVDLVGRSFGSMDAYFKEVFDELFDGGLVDVYPKVGKTDGAYCITVSISSPVFLLLNYSGQIDDVITIGHEMGHAIQMSLTKKQKNPFYDDINSLLLEVPSNLFEMFVVDELMVNLDDERRLSLLMEQLNDAVSSVFRQIACFKFEQDLHRSFRKSSFLSADEIGELFRKRMKEQLGDFVDSPEYSKNWWIYWSHIRSFFYVYSYASGDLLARYFYRKIKKNKDWVERFKTLMEKGSSDSPVNLMKSVGIDIKSSNVWTEGLNEIEEMLGEAEYLAKKLGKV